MTVSESIASDTVLLTRSDVYELLDMRSCITAVEEAFRADGNGDTLPSGMLGTHATHGGFHVKTAGVRGSADYYAAKVNANFPSNGARFGLPTIQGVLALFDADRGSLLALMDSMSVTAMRTAAATAVAARYLARPDSASVLVVGCGVQGRSQLRALRCVLPLTRIIAFDADSAALDRFVDDTTRETGIAIESAKDPRDAARQVDVIVTCTSSRTPILDRGDVSPGTFVAAVGADNEEKQEIAPTLLASSHVVVDSLEQCATIGDLHHAIAARAMRREDVFASLADVVVGKRAQAKTADRPIIFDSTGVALEDVAAARITYERARNAGRGHRVALGV
jgi:ornithine cyclodeaminase/alanine dehydrogenase-like protein (mu-crystallin family)